MLAEIGHSAFENRPPNVSGWLTAGCCPPKGTPLAVAGVVGPCINRMARTVRFLLFAATCFGCLCLARLWHPLPSKRIGSVKKATS